MADLCRKMAVWGLFLAVFGLFFFGFAQGNFFVCSDCVAMDQLFQQGGGGGCGLWGLNGWNEWS